MAAPASPHVSFSLASNKSYPTPPPPATFARFLQRKAFQTLNSTFQSWKSLIASHKIEQERTYGKFLEQRIKRLETQRVHLRTPSAIKAMPKERSRLNVGMSAVKKFQIPETPKQERKEGKVEGKGWSDEKGEHIERGLEGIALDGATLILKDGVKLVYGVNGFTKLGAPTATATAPTATAPTATVPAPPLSDLPQSSFSTSNLENVPPPTPSSIDKLASHSLGMMAFAGLAGGVAVACRVGLGGRR